MVHTYSLCRSGWGPVITDRLLVLIGTGWRHLAICSNIRIWTARLKLKGLGISNGGTKTNITHSNSFSVDGHFVRV